METSSVLNGCNIRPLLGAYALRIKGWIFYRATPAVTPGLSFSERLPH